MSAPKWLRLILEVLARLLRFREDRQNTKAVLHDLEKQSEQRKEEADEIDQQVIDADLYDLHERMRHYRRD